MANDPQKSPARENAEIQRVAAEAAKFEAEALAAQASARCSETLALTNEATARKTIAEAETFEVELRDAQRKERAKLASDEHNHAYNFVGGVDAASVRLCMGKLTEWSRLDPGCAIEIRLNSPGGSVTDGMALFDFIQATRRAGHHVTMVALGYAASMAGILLQAGDQRVIGRESYLLIHEIAAGTYGKIGEIKDDVKLYDMISERVTNIFVDRSDGKCTKATFKRNWTRTDWWLDSKQALRFGFVDEVR